MLESVRFIPLETTDQSLIGRTIGKIKKINNKYYVSTNRKELLEFDENGLFLRKIGRIGAGPGEYKELCDYDVFENGNILIEDAKKLIFYDEDGKYLHSVMLDFMPYNIKIVKDDRILVSGSGEEYMIYEIDLSGKIIKKEFKSNKASRWGGPIAFITYGQDKTITQIGNSNDFIFYNFNDKSFSYTKLVCDNILNSVKEEKLHQVYNGKYDDVYENVCAIFTVAGYCSHLFFLYGYLNNENKKFIQVLNIETGNIEHVISKKDIDDVTFTDNPFFILNAWSSDAQDCFITYVYPDKVWNGLKKHSDFEENPNYKKLKELVMDKSEDEVIDENPMLVEFVFK
jgi:hypothetical protein